MTFIQESKRQLAVIVIAIQSIVCSAAASPDSPSTPTPTGLFATDKNAGANVRKIVPGAAAMVDGHIISMNDLILECLRKYRSNVIDQMIQSYVIDRECKKRGITVSDAEIDKRIEDLRKRLAPTTLDEALKIHHTSMAELRNSLKQDIEAPILAADQSKSLRMLHVREILVKFKKANGAASGTNRTEAEALAIVKDLQAQLRQGKDFGALAEKYTESLPAEKKGDLGIFYDQMLHVEAPLLTAALALSKDEISQPVETSEGYCLIQATSTSGDHPPTENSLYQDADKASRDLQTMLFSQNVGSLIGHSKVTIVNDADLVPGKPLPAAAAVIDDHPIPMQDVVAKCLADNGPATVDVLVQNYLVDRECKQRGITASAAEIDQRVDKLREQIKPSTLEEGLAFHHTTLARLRYDFQQEIERQKLVNDQIKPTKMVHARVIFVKDNPSATSESISDTPCAEAQKLITDIQNQLKAGKSFEELTKQYSDPSGKSTGKDFGILYEGMREIEPTILNTALPMKKDEITPEPKHILGGHFFLQVISTSDSHSRDEDAAYAAAFTAYGEENSQPLIYQAIVNLLKKSKVFYYVHS